jgi:putative inorganic carbon (HCO3(-)) transporter
MHLSHKVRETAYFIYAKTIEWSLIFIIAVVPLIINPKAFDFWYRPKIESVYVLLIIAGIAWLLKASLKDKSFLWERNPLTVALLCYAFAAALSTILSVDVKLSLYGDPLRVEGLFTILAYISLVFLFINQVRTDDLARKLFIGLLLSASLISLYALIQYFGYDLTEHYFYKYLHKGSGVGSTIGNPNFLGKYLVLIIPIIFSLCLGEISFKKSVMMVLALSMCFAALIATFTRASWLGTIISVAVLLLLTFKNSLLCERGKRLFLIGIILFLIVFLFNIYSPSHGVRKAAPHKKGAGGEVIKKTMSAFDIKKGRGVATRLYVWRKALLLIKERPWFGYGLETFLIVFRKDNIEYMRIFNDLVFIDRAHNNYIDTAFSIGLIGLATYLVVIGVFLWHLFNLLEHARDRFHKLLYAGIISGYCGYLVNDFFIFSVVSVSPTFWSLMGLTIAKGRLEHSDTI